MSEVFTTDIDGAKQPDDRLRRSRSAQPTSRMNSENRHLSMPSYDGFRANNYKLILRTRPESREHDPERTIELGNPRPRPIVGINRELLAQRKLDDRLLLATPEEGGDATEDQDDENDQRPHAAVILRDQTVWNESESRTWSGVSSEDGERGRSGKAQ